LVEFRSTSTSYGCIWEGLAFGVLRFDEGTDEDLVLAYFEKRVEFYEAVFFLIRLGLLCALLSSFAVRLPLGPLMLPED